MARKNKLFSGRGTYHTKGTPGDFKNSSFYTEKND